MIKVLPDELYIKIFKIVFSDVLDDLIEYFTDLYETEYWDNR